jgi:predicted Ser/Thr protein kinase
MTEREIKKIKTKLVELEARLTKLESIKETYPQKIRKLSINEFIRSKNPKNDVEKTLTIGYYLEQYESMENFNSNDMKKYFIKAKERIPPNISDKIQKSIKKGHIMDSEETKNNLKTYILTNTGIKFVENNFKET